MIKRLFVIACAAIVMFGCAKRQTIKPTVTSQTQKPGAEGTRTPGSSAEAEPSNRYTDWEAVPELKTIYFSYDQSELQSDARAMLKVNAEYLKSNDTLNVLVEGHCDDRGTTEYNLALGQHRAAAVREYYGQLGVSLNRVATISYGKEKPAVQGSNDEAWAKNRRVETKVRGAGLK